MRKMHTVVVGPDKRQYVVSTVDLHDMFGRDFAGRMTFRPVTRDFKQETADIHVETRVFECDFLGEVIDWTPVDGANSGDTKLAPIQHETMVRKWARGGLAN